MIVKLVSWILWAACTIVVVACVTMPVSIPSQFTTSAAILAAMMVLYIFKSSGVSRQIFLALGTAIILRYVYWRATSTLPPIDSLVDFVPAVVLLLAELFCVLMLAMSLFVTSDPIERPAAPRFDDAALPSVDVFVPSYNEGTRLVAVTLAAAKALDYPADKLRVHLLDDGGTDEKCESDNPAVAEAAWTRRNALQALCADLGVNYITRERNVHAKAGNLNNGLRHTGGDLVVVFDADHAPTPEFLRETVGHFVADTGLFLVQTPHFFLNPDPIERNLGTFSVMPSENEMFYGTIQKGLDNWNSAFFCGSAAVLRRSALEEVGGFSGLSITEDCETALELHSRGWRSLYVDRPMIAGLQPETFASFIGQRSRWCAGMMQILLMKNPLFKRGLSLAQRICYLSSSMFWFFPLPRLAFLFAPLLYIFFNMKIYVANQQEFVAYTAMYMVAVTLMQSYNYGKVRWPWVSELYEYCQSIYLIRPLLGVFINPRKPKFNVTSKSQTLAEDQVSSLAAPYYVIFLILAAAEAMVFYRYRTEPLSRDLLLVIAIWNSFNLAIAGLALGVVSERRERRESPRLDTSRRARLELADQSHDVIVEDVSQGGLRVEVVGKAIKLPKDVRVGDLIVQPGGKAEHLRVHVALAGNRNSGGKTNSLGLRFYGGSHDQYVGVANLLYGDLSQLRKARLLRRRARGMTRGTIQFLAWSVAQTVRGFSYLLFHRGGGGEKAPQRRGVPQAAE